VAFDRWPVRLALAALLSAAVGLAACGRKGPLDVPPDPALAEPATTLPPPPPGAPEAANAKYGFDAQGNPVAPTGPRKRFFLDPLLD
jgi:predicted small lipoprotein YifL